MPARHIHLLTLILILVATLENSVHAQEPPTYHVGLARIDITPRHPIRLSGFGFRRAESEGVTQRIWAKAMAIDDGGKAPVLLITVDILGIPADIFEEIAPRLEKKAGLKKERLAITATHTHTAPMLKGANQTLFSMPIPKEHLANIDRYTSEFLEKVEKVGLDALTKLEPAKLSWGVGKVDFAVNRRTKGGPVDHDLPVLVVRDLKGKTRAVYVNYACHCVTLSNNKISGDWAGYAQEAIEDAFPGTLALVSVGCGADSNPSSGVTGDKVEIAAKQGRDIAQEVKRVAAQFLAPVTGKIEVAWKNLTLPLATLLERKEWEAKANRKDAVGYHARVQLERLDRKEELPTKIDYPIQTWRFGDSLAMVFLPGEVVVDYSLRLKRGLDGKRLWINAYANNNPCYIPSERVLKEGGYEGRDAMVYYDLPGPFKPGLEQPIIDTVKEQLGKRFAPAFDANKTQGTRPLSPQQSQATLKVRSGLVAELVVAEPLVVDPVAIDFGPDGKLYVAEMIDYPEGKGGKYEPGGRIRLLEKASGGRQPSGECEAPFDKATVFLDNIPFPTGVTVWRKGVLVCAAPDILYAEDTDGDGKADVVKKLFSGFGTGNYQARVNSLEYGLDGWVYGSCGLFGGKIKSFNGKEYALGDRDFRIKADTGELEPATGRTQQGRVRDDWGNWFGCDNSNLCWHYPLADHYLRRNQHVAPPPAAVNVIEDGNVLYPLPIPLQLFKLSGPPGRATAACGLAIYRDDLLGKQFQGNVFTCEPVNLCVTRRILSPKGSTFVGRRADDEKDREFLASNDTWFRPVQARTGPDGCLWIVDMYRFVIEHPRWIPPEDLAKLDLRAGQGMGRIYRILPKDKTPQTWKRLDKLDTAGLVAALDSPNGWQRDMAMQMLIWKKDQAVVPKLEELVSAGVRAETRLQAISTLGALAQASPKVVVEALSDKHPGVRRHALLLVKPEFGLAAALLNEDEDAQVRLQVAFSFVHWRDPRAGFMLGRMATRYSDDPHFVAAALTSVNSQNLGAVFSGVLNSKRRPSAQFIRQLVGLAVVMESGKALQSILESLPSPHSATSDWQMAQITGLVEALDRKGISFEKLPPEQSKSLRPWFEHASKTLADAKVGDAQRIAALPLVGRNKKTRDDDLGLLTKLLSPASSPTMQNAAVTTLGRVPDTKVPALLLSGWSAHSPSLKSQILDVLLSRPAWQQHLLASLEKSVVLAGDVDLPRRQRLLNHPDSSSRARAAKVFAGTINADRQKVLDEYRDALKLAGDPVRGKAVFAKTCAACHVLDGVGYRAGPDLAALVNKTPQYLLQEILDPSRNLDSRYVQYMAVTKNGQVFTGLLASESSTAITLLAQEGKQQVLLRTDLEELTSSARSLMPDGLEKELSKQDLADLLAYLTQGPKEKVDPTALARQLLDDKLPAPEREKLLAKSSVPAADLIKGMVADLRPGTMEEYRRIPWIWRVAIAAGKRNQEMELRELLAVGLPKKDQALLDWQAVVLGGGVINGISLVGAWPDKRLQSIVNDRAELDARLQRSVQQAFTMADDEKVPTGTRYDALRMLALDKWDSAGPALTKYLGKKVHPELQMGAVSALADMNVPQATEALLKHLDQFTRGNRNLAISGLLKTEARVSRLLDELEKGKINRAWLTDGHRAALLKLKNDNLRRRAEMILTRK